MMWWFYQKERWWVCWPGLYSNGLFHQWYAIRSTRRPSRNDWTVASGPFEKGEAIIEAARLNKLLEQHAEARRSKRKT